MEKRRPRDVEYDHYTHGNARFPIGIHKTIVAPNPAVGENARYQILYTHWHSEFEFFYLSQGSCVFVIDGAEHELASGDAVLVPPNATHWAYRLASTAETVFYAVVFSHVLLSDGSADIVNEKYIAPVLSGELLMPPVYKRSVPWQSDVLDLLIDIMALYDYTPYDNDPYSGKHPELFLREDTVCPELFIKATLLGIWYKCIPHAESGEKRGRMSRTNHERVQAAIEYINRHYSGDLSLQEIAESVFMSREYFAHVFKECTGTSPFSYLNEYRVRRGMELLETTDLSVTEIAFRCGFNQVSYFNRKFSELAKCTPTEYRRGRAAVTSLSIGE